MRKILFYGTFLVIGYFVFTWIKGYYTIPKEERGQFITFVVTDSKATYEYGKKAIVTFPSWIVSKIENQEEIYSQVTNQITKSLEFHYALNGTYPKLLSAVIDYEILPVETEVEYRVTKDGYKFRLKDNKGNVLREVIKKTP